MITPVQGAEGTVEIGDQKADASLTLSIEDWKIDPYQIPDYAPGSQRPKGPKAKRSYANLSREAALYVAGYVKLPCNPPWEWTTQRMHHYLMEAVTAELEFRATDTVRYTEALRNDLVKRYVQGRYPFYFPPDVKPGGVVNRTV